jgi:tetratricopeptide (TPR) repeat protein
MTSTTRNVLIGIVVVLVIALLGYFDWQERQTSAPALSTSTTTSATSTGTSINVSGSGATTTSTGYTVTPIYSSSGSPTPPNYKTQLTFPAGTNAAVEAQYQSQFASIQTTLATSPYDYPSWIQLGIVREETGDYTGAAADWKYVTEIYPQGPTAFADLGNLYATYLNENSQAITDYKEAIKLDPTHEETFYQNLAQVYINEGDTADAKATLEEGISAQVIGYQNLQEMLNSMQ